MLIHVRLSVEELHQDVLVYVPIVIGYDPPTIRAFDYSTEILQQEVRRLIDEKVNQLLTPIEETK